MNVFRKPTYEDFHKFYEMKEWIEDFLPQDYYKNLLPEIGYKYWGSSYDKKKLSEVIINALKGGHYRWALYFFDKVADEEIVFKVSIFSANLALSIYEEEMHYCGFARKAITEALSLISSNENGSIAYDYALKINNNISYIKEKINKQILISDQIHLTKVAAAAEASFYTAIYSVANFGKQPYSDEAEYYINKEYIDAGLPIFRAKDAYKDDEEEEITRKILFYAIQLLKMIGN